jgi:hypothetical protein
MASCFSRVRMLEMRRRANLGQEPRPPDDRGELGVQHLDGDVPIVPEVVSEVHGGHAARAQDPLDAVDVGEWRGEALQNSRHGAPRLLVWTGTSVSRQTEARS